MRNNKVNKIKKINNFITLKKKSQQTVLSTLMSGIWPQWKHHTCIVSCYLTLKPCFSHEAAGIPKWNIETAVEYGGMPSQNTDFIQFQKILFQIKGFFCTCVFFFLRASFLVFCFVLFSGHKNTTKIYRNLFFYITFVCCLQKITNPRVLKKPLYAVNSHKGWCSAPPVNIWYLGSHLSKITLSLVWAHCFLTKD